jgi:threonine dehydrogenase-like Zn-dependent dehydrogenase
MGKSLAAVLERPNRVTLKEFPIPDIGFDGGLLKVEMVGICSSDVKIYQGKVTLFPSPLIMGHETVGRIAKIGQNAAKKRGVHEGDRVVLQAHTSCGACEDCLTGNYRFCKSALGYGLKTSCDVPPICGVATVSICILLLVDIEADDLVGLVKRLTDSRGVDLVLDVTGSPLSFAVSLEAVRQQGTVVLAGVIGNEVKVPIILDRIMQKEIKVQGVRSKGYQATAAAVSLVESGKYPLEQIVTAEYPLSDCESALKIAAGEGNVRPLKVVLKPWG